MQHRDVESGPHVWRVDIQKLGDFASKGPEPDLLADTQALSVSRVALKGGESGDLRGAMGAAALILCAGEGQIEISGRTRHICAGSVELVCSGESGKVTAFSDLTAYLVIAKERR